MIKEQLNMLVNLAAADTSVAEKEARHVRAIGIAAGFSKEEVDEMLKKPQPVDDLSYLTDDQKFEYLYNIIQLMKIDGQVFKSEIVFCERIAEKLGYRKKVVGELSTHIYSDPNITADRDDLKSKAQKFLV
ncbi:MAG: TerB family tellurite resistance protein [Bacteroidetes bacterium]|nr:TerB family tellurite resistance protein [Bacteroidota bacterium]